MVARGRPFDQAQEPIHLGGVCAGLLKRYVCLYAPQRSGSRGRGRAPASPSICCTHAPTAPCPARTPLRCPSSQRASRSPLPFPTSCRPPARRPGEGAGRRVHAGGAGGGGDAHQAARQVSGQRQRAGVGKRPRGTAERQARELKGPLKQRGYHLPCRHVVCRHTGIGVLLGGVWGAGRAGGPSIGAAACAAADRAGGCVHHHGLGYGHRALGAAAPALALLRSVCGNAVAKGYSGCWPLGGGARHLVRCYLVYVRMDIRNDKTVERRAKCRSGTFRRKGR